MRVAVFTLGGTVSMTPPGGGLGAVPALAADELLAAVPGLASSGVELVVRDFRQVPGASLTIGDVIELAGEIDSEVADGDLDLRRVTHHTIDEVTRLLGAYRLNVAVARLMELVTAARRTIDTGPGAGDPAVREAAEVLAVLLSLFAPYTAEECWQLLGREASVAKAGWPQADPALLVAESVTCVVQVNGKVRDRLEVAPGIAEDDLREAALSAAGVIRALGGQSIRKVIVRAPKLVNIVAN